jgi:hypothetical protein
VKFRKVRWAQHVARMRDKCIKNFGGETCRKQLLRRPKRRWDNVRVTGCEDRKWMELVQFISTGGLRPGVLLPQVVVWLIV